MTTAVLKKSLGEAGAFIDESSGRPSRLLEVLTAMVEGLAERLTGAQSTPATAVLSSVLADKALDMDASIQLNMGTTGTSGAATAELKVAGAIVASATVDNTDADGTTNSGTGTVSVKAGDLVELEVTAIPGSGADLVATGRLRPVTVE